jgi:phosphopentomutase
VGRVIARPFDGVPGSFTRTAGRRDFALDPAALDPPQRSYLDELAGTGVDVHAVGKVADLFASRGIAHSHPAADNGRALATLATLLGAVEEGLLFVNLIDTDQLHGHRKDHAGFHEALRRIDVAVGELASRLRDDDLLVLTADHGVDMDHPSGDHTREHVPLLAGDGAMVRASLGIGPTRPPGTRHVGPMADVGATLLRRLGHADAPALPGSAFAG